MDLKEIIPFRRNVKPQFFTGEQIEDLDVKEILESANWAPTHGYTEPWRFIVFSGESISNLATFQSNLYKSKTSTESFQQIKFDKLVNTPSLASHIIAVVVHKSVNTTIPLLEEIVATSCAVQNVLLTAATKEISVHWTSGGMTYTDEMKNYLGFEEKDRVIGFLYLGKSDHRINKEGRRLTTIESKTIWK
jgi:nitroreductase